MKLRGLVIKSTSGALMCVGILFAQSGCMRFSEKTSSAGDSLSGATNLKGITNEALPLVNSPYPGPYKTVEIANPEAMPEHIQECRQGRFPNGISD